MTAQLTQMPISALRLILQNLDIIDQSKFRRVCRKFSDAAPLSCVDSDKIGENQSGDCQDTDDGRFSWLKEKRKLDDFFAARRANRGTSSDFMSISCLSYDRGLEVLVGAMPDFPGSIACNRFAAFSNVESFAIPHDKLILQRIIGKPSIDLSVNCDQLAMDEVFATFLESLTDLNLLRVKSISLGALRFFGSIPLPRASFASPSWIPSRNTPGNIRQIILAELPDRRSIPHLPMFTSHLALQLSHKCPYDLAKSNPSILRVSMDSIELTDSLQITSFDFLQHLRHLKRLTVWCANITVSDLQHLPTSIELEILDVSDSGAISDDLIDWLINGKYPIRRLKADFIETLERRPSPGLTSSGIARYLQWTKCLEHLSIMFNERVDNTIFEASGDYISHLHFLNISRTAIDESGLEVLHKNREAKRSDGSQVPELMIRSGLHFSGTPEMTQSGLSFDRFDWTY